MTSPGTSPCIYVVAAPNGAGKTTFAQRFLPSFADCDEFVNADLIAAGLSPFAPQRQARRAGRLVLQRVQELTAEGRTFAMETTLAGLAYIRFLRVSRLTGYRVHAIFLHLPSVELAGLRVAERVR